MSVSYTHLDVYKRQGHHHGRIPVPLERQRVGLGIGLQGRTAAPAGFSQKSLQFLSLIHI